MDQHKCIIGIDPDSEASGVAVLDVTARRFVSVRTLSFPDLISAVRQYAARNPGTRVYVEAGWMNPSNWHISPRDSRYKCAALGVDVGRNQETGRKIIEMLKYYGVTVTGVPPLKKVWGEPKDGKPAHEKISHKEIILFAPLGKNRSNQEERDAALLAWDKAGLPIRIDVKRKA